MCLTVVCARRCETHVEHLPDDEHEPLLGEAAHVEPRLSGERHLELLLQVALLGADLPDTAAPLSVGVLAHVTARRDGTLPGVAIR